MSQDDLPRMIEGAMIEGVVLRRKGYGRPIGGSSLEDIKQRGWDRAKEHEEWTDTIRVWRRRLAHGKFLRWFR